MKDKYFIAGSRVFFGRYKDYEPHDYDYVVFTNSSFDGKNLKLTQYKSDCYYFKFQTKEEFIKEQLPACKETPMAAQKFLTPKICKYLNFTLDDLKLFEECYNNMDDKHTYLKIIYDAYLENGDFTLTDEQRDKAYQEYKIKRNKN